MPKRLNFQKVQRTPIIYLSGRDYDALVKALKRPAPPNPRLREAMQRAMKWFKD